MGQLSWIFGGKEFSDEDISDYYGFVYLITNTITERKYIGKKWGCKKYLLWKKVNSKETIKEL